MKNMQINLHVSLDYGSYTCVKINHQINNLLAQQLAMDSY